MVVLDTSALLYWAFAPEMLTEKAAAAIASAQEIVINSISIWEIGLKVKNGKLDLPLSPAAFVVQLEMTDKVRIEPVSAAIWLKSLELAWAHKDPADRALSPRPACSTALW